MIVQMKSTIVAHRTANCKLYLYMYTHHKLYTILSVYCVCASIVENMCVMRKCEHPMRFRVVFVQREHNFPHTIERSYVRNSYAHCMFKILSICWSVRVLCVRIGIDDIDIHIDDDDDDDARFPNQQRQKPTVHVCVIAAAMWRETFACVAFIQLECALSHVISASPPLEAAVDMTHTQRRPFLMPFHISPRSVCINKCNLLVNRRICMHLDEWKYGMSNWTTRTWIVLNNIYPVLDFSVYLQK